MSYRVLLHPKAAEFLRKIEVNLRNRIKDSLRQLENSPKKRGKRLRHTPFYRIRIGDYRAIYMVEEEDKRVVVLFIGHRKDVYDDFSRVFF